MRGLIRIACVAALVGAVGSIIPVDGAAVASPEAAADANRGKTLYMQNCASCHGNNGDGKGLNASTLNPPPTDLTTPRFWKGDAPKRIQNAVRNGKGSMPPVNLNAEDVQAIIAYTSSTFKPGSAR